MAEPNTGIRRLLQFDKAAGSPRSPALRDDPARDGAIGRSAQPTKAAVRSRERALGQRHGLTPCAHRPTGQAEATQHHSPGRGFGYAGDGRPNPHLQRIGIRAGPPAIGVDAWREAQVEQGRIRPRVGGRECAAGFVQGGSPDACGSPSNVDAKPVAASRRSNRVRTRAEIGRPGRTHIEGHGIEARRHRPKHRIGMLPADGGEAVESSKTRKQICQIMARLARDASLRDMP